MKRLPDWQLRLEEFIKARHGVPFSWGQQDCALFACDAVQACTGHDMAAGIRGTYSDAKGATRIIRKAGGLGNIAASRAGEEISPLMAQPGDLGLVEQAGRESLCIWTGNAWHGPADCGLTALPLETAKRAWRTEK